MVREVENNYIYVNIYTYIYLHIFLGSRIPYRDKFSRLNRENFHCNAINCKAMKSLVKIYANACICIYFKRAEHLNIIKKLIFNLNIFKYIILNVQTTLR